MEELLTNLKNCSPRFFENLVVELLVSLGYGGSFTEAGMAIGKSGDEGIDGIIKEQHIWGWMCSTSSEKVGRNYRTSRDTKICWSIAWSTFKERNFYNNWNIFN